MENSYLQEVLKGIRLSKYLIIFYLVTLKKKKKKERNRKDGVEEGLCVLISLSALFQSHTHFNLFFKN